MRIEEIRKGNIVLFKGFPFEVKGFFSREGKDGEEVSFIMVRSVRGSWEEKCRIHETEGMDISEAFLKANGFVVPNKAMPEVWARPLGGYRYLRYHAGVKSLDFETTNCIQRVPWAVRKVHQMQNACTDYGLEIGFGV